jgi:hypothetical protein
MVRVPVPHSSWTYIVAQISKIMPLTHVDRSAVVNRVRVLLYCRESCHIGAQRAYTSALCWHILLKLTTKQWGRWQTHWTLTWSLQRRAWELKKGELRNGAAAMSHIGMVTGSKARLWAVLLVFLIVTQGRSVRVWLKILVTASDNIDGWMAR